MVLINKNFVVLFLFLMLCIAPFNVFAARSQSKMEAVWLVENPLDGVAVPLYSSGETPFPIMRGPTEEELRRMAEERERREKMLRQRLSVSQQQELEAQNLLEDLRLLISDSKNFTPELEDFKVSAVMKGDGGVALLVDNNWIREGDTLVASIGINSVIQDKLDRLSSMKPELASVMRSKIDEAYKIAGTKELSIVSIGDKEIVLRSGEEEYVIFIDTSSYLAP